MNSASCLKPHPNVSTHFIERSTYGFSNLDHESRPPPGECRQKCASERASTYLAIACTDSKVMNSPWLSPFIAATNRASDLSRAFNPTYLACSVRRCAAAGRRLQSLKRRMNAANSDKNRESERRSAAKCCSRSPFERPDLREAIRFGSPFERPGFRFKPGTRCEATGP